MACRWVDESTSRRHDCAHTTTARKQTHQFMQSSGNQTARAHEWISRVNDGTSRVDDGTAMAPQGMWCCVLRGAGCFGENCVLFRRQVDSTTARRHDTTTSTGHDGTTTGHSDNNDTTTRRHTARWHDHRTTTAEDNGRGRRQMTTAEDDGPDDSTTRTAKGRTLLEKAFCSRRAGGIGETKRPFRFLDVGKTPPIRGRARDRTVFW